MPFQLHATAATRCATRRPAGGVGADHRGADAERGIEWSGVDANGGVATAAVRMPFAGARPRPAPFNSTPTPGCR